MSTLKIPWSLVAAAILFVTWLSMRSQFGDSAPGASAAACSVAAVSAAANTSRSVPPAERGISPRRRHPDRRTSSFDEVGGWGKEYAEAPFPGGGAQERMVAMRNVCYSRSQKNFVLYLDPRRRRGVPFVFGERAQSLDAACWVDLHPQAQIYGETQHCLRPLVEYGFVPAHAWWHDAESATLHAMRSSDENYGHFLLDEMLQTFILQWAWDGDASFDNQMVYINRVPTGPVDWFTSLARFWTRRAPFFLNEVRLDRELVCFPRLLAGAGATRFHVFRSLSTRVLTQQRAFVYRNARIAPPPPPLSEHLILVYVKESSSGRARSMANANALLAALDAELGKTGHTFNGRPVRVVSGEVWKGGFAKELAQLAAASVMFAPPGGICFSGLFLRPQASMVLLDWWCDGKRSCRFAQEANVWAKFPDRYMYYYTLDRDEIRGTNDVRWSGPGVYHLRPEKFVKSVMDALDMADLRLRGGEGEPEADASGSR